MAYILELSMSRLLFNTLTWFGNQSDGVGVDDGRIVFPSVLHGTEGYKIFAIIVAVVCVVAIIMFIVFVVKSYRESKQEEKNFGARVQGDLQYPGYRRGDPKPVIDPKDKGKDKWGKIDDDW